MATLKNVDLFRTGTHTDSAGRTRNWSKDDLLKISNQYNPATQEAPAVIGHPKQTAPAYGWVKKVWVDGEFLKADFEQVAPEFETALKEGRYKKRSISVNKNFELQHVAFLGSAAPAVSGLKDIEFSASADFETYEFTTNEGARPEEDDMDLAAALAEIEKLKGELKAATDEIKKIKDNDEKSDYAAKLKVAEDKAKEAADSLAQFYKEQADAQLEARLDKLVADDKLLPGEKEKTLNFARSMADEEATMDFSQDGKSEKVTPREAYLLDLESQPVNGLLSEFAVNGSGYREKVVDTNDITSKL